MSKQKDLKLVFEFIADFLKDSDNADQEKISKPKFSGTTSWATSEIKLETKTPTKKNSWVDHTLDLMNKVEQIGKERAKINHLLFKEKKTFERELNKIREEYLKNISKEHDDEVKEDLTNNEIVSIIDSSIDQNIISKESKEI